MAGNFVIQYMGREGSSAIISALSAQMGVNVPVFEDLDDYKFLNHFTVQDYPRVLDDIFSTGAYAGPCTQQESLFQLPKGQKPVVTGFKWRVNGELSEIADVFLRHDVTLFALQRRDFLSYVSSIYVHRYGNELVSSMDVPMHPHFDKAHNTKHGADAAQREKLNQLLFPLDKKKFFAACKKALKMRHSQTAISRRLYRKGVTVKAMYYEDFDADPQAFVTQMLAGLGHDIHGDYDPKCKFEKVHKTPLAQRIEGIKKATRSWRYRYYEHNYQSTARVTESFYKR